MTAKETLNRVIDNAVVNVPPSHRNDFQNKRPDCGPYIICLQAMEEYATQQAQEMKEDRDKAVDLLNSLNRHFNDYGVSAPLWPLASEILSFTNSQNNNHERKV